jgi:phosphoribosyl-ATP pyrophosphohydrolase
VNDPQPVDRLYEMLRLQRQLQTETFGANPAVMQDADRIQYIKDMVLAATDELHEVLAEVGWKPWATSRHVNRDAYVSELVDVWHFVMNLLIAVDCGPEELYTKYLAKRSENARRQEAGYDGVSEKCSQCHRDLLESKAHGSPCDPLHDWCGVYGAYVST